MMQKHRKNWLYTFFLLSLFSSVGWNNPSLGQDARIKDLVNVRGNRSNQLTGFGLVVGLSGTGDSASSLITTRAAMNLVNRLGMITKGGKLPTQSLSAVVVTAELPAFAKNGDKIPVKVSTVGDTKSLAGGTLLLTELKAGDGEIYVVAQGSLVVGPADGSGAKVLTSAFVPVGGFVEKEFNPEILDNGRIHLSLRNADFTTNARIVEKVNNHFKGFYAVSKDPSNIEISVPENYSNNLVEFISEMEGIHVQFDQKAVVVMTERTGTIVMGSDVVISKVSISHGDLSISVGGGKGDKKESLVSLKGTTVGDLVEKLNALGAKPTDLVSILQAIHVAGALNADLRVM